MSEKRRDNKNRVLRYGESRRPDGRYAYKYKDNDGKVRFVYSWRLDENDRTPAGRKPELSLREKEKQIEHDLFDYIAVNGGNYTVLDKVQQHLQGSDAEDHAARLPAHLLLEHGKKRHEPQDPAVHHGALGHQRHPQHVHPRRL